MGFRARHQFLRIPCKFFPLTTGSIGLMLIMTSVNTYLVDGYHQYSAFVIGAANFLRAIFSSCTPLFAVPMEAALGPGWTL